MASLILTVVGTAISGPFGGLVGGLVGSYLDQAFIYPSLFGRPSGPRLEDLQVQTATEGTYARYVLGPKNRLAGTLIWASDFIEHSRTSKKGVTVYTYKVNVAVAVCEGPIRKIKRIWADSKIIYDNGVIDRNVKNGIRIYVGTSDQEPDELLESLYPGENPAYRGTAYVVIKGLVVTDWGNRIPNFSFEVVADSHMPVQRAIKKIVERAGLDPDTEIDTTRVPGCLRGYVVLGPQETIKILEPLMTAFSLGARDANGVLTFWRRGEEDHYGIVPVSDLGAHEYGQEAAAHVVRITDTHEFQLPSQVVVQHFDPDWDLQQGSQRERMWNSVNTDVTSITLPLTLSVDEARRIAKILLWSTHSERRLVEFDLPPSYIRVQEGDLITVPLTISGFTARIRALEISRGYNWLIRVRGHITELGTYEQSARVDRRTPSPPRRPPSPLQWHILDIPAITSNEQQTLGFYVAAAFSRSQERWYRAQGYKSLDGEEYEEAWVHERESLIGETVTALDDYSASPLWWDNVNTVDVLMYEGTLASASESAVLSGANRVLIGNEIVGFRNAALIAPRTYRLSGLLRGLRDTQKSISGHAIGERVIVLTSNLVFYTGIEFSDLWATRYYKNVPFGADVTLEPARAVMLTGATFRHFTPCHVSAVKSTGNNDCLISWGRRTRALIPPFTPGDPLFEPGERYIVEIRRPEGVVLRTLPVPLQTTVNYTQEMQYEDGLDPGVTGFFVYVYQLSSIAGRSNPGIVYYTPIS